MNSKLQLERPMSRAEAIPAGASCIVYGCQFKIGRFRFVHLSHIIRQLAAKTNLTTRCVITMESG